MLPRGQASRFILLYWVCATGLTGTAIRTAIAQTENVADQIQEAPPTPQVEGPAPQRGVSVGLVGQSLLREPFGATSPGGGFGLHLLYEFHITQKFFLGVDLTWRMYPSTAGAAASIHQIGYGLRMRHALSSGEVQPFLVYGLLLQNTRLKGVVGSLTSHDTLLGAGVDFLAARRKFFLEGSWHYSRAGYLGISTHTVLDYLQLVAGHRWQW